MGRVTQTAKLGYSKNRSLPYTRKTVKIQNIWRNPYKTNKMKKILEKFIAGGLLENRAAEEMFYAYQRGEKVEVPFGVNYLIG